MASSRIKSILAPVIISGIILVLLELISRVVLSHLYNRRFDSSLIVENKYGTSPGLKSDATGTVWGKPFHTDDMGGRKAIHAHKGKQKVLVIGDSVTEGVGVEDSLTFANIINDRSDTFDIRNISLIGWSIYDYRNTVDNLIAKASSIRAVYLFYCLNDIYGNTPAKAMPAIADKGLISNINAFFQDKYATYKLIKLLIYQNSNRYYQYDKAFYKDNNRINNVMAALDHIKKVCDSNKVVLNVFILPYRSQLENPNNRLPQEVLISRFKKDNINYTDLLPGMSKASNPKTLYLFADEIHLSPLGHRVIANIILP